jgi:hypothetical protein
MISRVRTHKQRLNPATLTTMSDTATDKDNKIAMLMGMGGASKEYAARVLEESGGNLNRAMEQLYGVNHSTRTEEITTTSPSLTNNMYIGTARATWMIPLLRSSRQFRFTSGKNGIPSTRQVRADTLLFILLGRIFT